MNQKSGKDDKTHFFASSEPTLTQYYQIYFHRNITEVRIDCFEIRYSQIPITNRSNQEVKKLIHDDTKQK